MQLQAEFFSYASSNSTVELGSKAYQNCLFT